MDKDFYKEEEDYLRVMKGEPLNMNYLLQLGSPNLLGNTHLLTGQLNKIGNQLFIDLAPSIGPGSNILIRQKTDMGNVVAVEVVVKNGQKKEHVKSRAWHYQPKNTGSLYYTEFKINSTPIYLAIGSGISIDETLEYFREKTLEK